MAEITVNKKYEGWNNNIKTLVIDANSTPSSSDTYDTDMDASDGRGSEFREIFEAVYVTEDGTEHVDCTWSNSTGIVTIGTISTPTESGYLHIKGI